MKITHYWSIIRPSNPPMVYVKDSDGRTYSCFMYSKDRYTNPYPCPEPQPIIGYSPKTNEFGYKFGEWVTIENFDF